MSRQLVAGIETGGTKILAKICSFDGDVVAEGRWETGSADEAPSDLTLFLTSLPAESQLSGVGMAAFGPLIVDPGSPDFGNMLATPKPGGTGSPNPAISARWPATRTKLLSAESGHAVAAITAFYFYPRPVNEHSIDFKELGFDYATGGYAKQKRRTDCSIRRS